jgi:polyphosphate kinase 2
VNRKEYENELRKLQIELVKLQAWVKETKAKIVIIFEGRDAAGKGGVIRRITERVSSRVFRIVALPTPTEREKSQMYLQRYISQFPAGGEIVLFDRSWYNRAMVEKVMGFCTEEESQEFLVHCPKYEAALVRSQIILIKYFFDVSRKDQEKRFLKRINDPLRQWKLSSMDLESYRRWWDYTKAIDEMMAATDTEFAPWYIVKADNKEEARLNCISHLLSIIPYEEIPFETPKLPKIKKKEEDTPDKPLFTNYIPEIYK